MGGWFQGERVVFRGKDLFNELSDLPWMGLLLHGITGRFFTDKQIRLFEAIWTLSTSYPDPRIWNNRVTALAGTARSTSALAIGAATAVSEASIYGRRPDIRSIDFLFRTKEHLEDGGDLTNWITRELKERRGVSGYGRPVVRNDERLQPLMKIANELGLGDGSYTKLAFEVERILVHGRWRMYMNVAALIAALAADQGLSTREFYQYMILCFSGGMFPCQIDATAKAEGSFFPLRCNRISYEGKSRRNWNSTR
ncbi:hypothetical protein ACFL0R_02970 [Pseudomonadota bacterium]